MRAGAGSRITSGVTTGVASGARGVSISGVGSGRTGGTTSTGGDSGTAASGTVLVGGCCFSAMAIASSGDGAPASTAVTSVLFAALRFRSFLASTLGYCVSDRTGVLSGLPTGILSGGGTATSAVPVRAGCSGEPSATFELRADRPVRAAAPAAPPRTPPKATPSSTELTSASLSSSFFRPPSISAF